MSKWFWLFLCISVEMVVVDLYSIVALSSICERERERERVSRRVGGWVQGG